jgi:L-glyceraldehyde 3-phosphate reductase
MYSAPEKRYDVMKYTRCGRTGLLLPSISLGLWHNFGETTPMETSRQLLRTAFDLGITHFDLANNYGPPYGSAEETYGRIHQLDFLPYRDELILSTKAGYDMWPGPYGNFGSRKYLFASLHQSLRRMGLDYVDIFYHHRPDPSTPLEETMGALDAMVRQGKALYVGISNYPADRAAEAIGILKKLGTPCLIHQARYSMLDRWVENGLLDVLEEGGVGCIAFSPLAKGILTDRYLHGIPDDSRAAVDTRFLKPADLTPETLERVRRLDAVARQRGQSLAQLALAWVLRDPRMTSVLIGASKPSQIEDCVRAISAPPLDEEELKTIEVLLG